METTRLSTKGQIVLPMAVRVSRSWGPGTEFIVEPTDEVAGCLRYGGRAKTIAQMDAAITDEVTRRHGRGRY
jgi:hypothetical protein